MTIQKNGDLLINGIVVAYEGNVKVKKGSLKRTSHPQVNGKRVITASIEENMSMITVTARVNRANNDYFDSLFDNEDNNVIEFDGDSFTSCNLEVKPEREDLETVDYVFYGDPA